MIDQWGTRQLQSAREAGAQYLKIGWRVRCPRLTARYTVLRATLDSSPRVQSCSKLKKTAPSMGYATRVAGADST